MQLNLVFLADYDYIKLNVLGNFSLLNIINFLGNIFWKSLKRLIPATGRREWIQEKQLDGYCHKNISLKKVNLLFKLLCSMKSE